MLRTHTCGELTEKQQGKQVTLAGWVNSRRDHGGLIFIDLRDRYGITQVTFDPKIDKDAWKIVDSVRDEFVIVTTGKVINRPKDMVNQNLATGSIEIEATKIVIVSKSKTPPFEVAWQPEGEKTLSNEELRLKYRYLDLRRKKMLDNLKLRADFVKAIRDYLHEDGFLEVDTPILTKSSPEGARDFLVPSRLYPGKFYALPQSPQQYKQLLMVGGIDKYFQLAPCMRDEDARADRSPAEFYQLDLEMSFVEQKDILDFMEKMFTKIVEEVSDKKIMAKPWPRLQYDDVMMRYGVDKPDIRFGLEIQDVSELVQDSGFSVFTNAIKKEGVVRCINAKDASSFSRGDIDSLTELVKECGAKGLAYIVIEKDGSIKSPITKFLGDMVTDNLIKKMKGKKGDILFFGADKESVVCESLGTLRSILGKQLGLIDKNLLAFCFIVGWPLFEPEIVDGHYAPAHHMFTMPVEEDRKKLDSDPGSVRSLQHDMVLNGFEVGGGSIRVHEADIQEKIFKLIGFKKDRVKFFSHMLEAFAYGAPPHGGMAPGIDRLVMILAGEENMREVVAFPKNQKAQDLVTGAPDSIEPQQLKELHLRSTKD
jgi:aspartyl-tRNA synthetase